MFTKFECIYENSQTFKHNCIDAHKIKVKRIYSNVDIKLHTWEN